MQDYRATIQSVRSESSVRDGLVLRFSTVLENGTTTADHGFPGDEGFRLLRMAGTFDIRDLEGRACIVFYDPDKSIMEWAGFAELLDTEVLHEQGVG